MSQRLQDSQREAEEANNNNKNNNDKTAENVGNQAGKTHNRDKESDTTKPPAKKRKTRWQ